MAKKLGITLVMLFLLQGIACAGLINIYVASGKASGSIDQKGGYAATAKTYTLSASAGYTLDYVTKNGAKVLSSEILGTGPSWTYTVPLSSASQTVYVYFKSTTPANPPVLLASAPAAVSAGVNTPLLISGGTSTILYLQPDTKAKYKWSSTTTAPTVTFSPISSSVTSPAYISTAFTTAAAGTYTATLTLTAPGATPSSTDVKVTVAPPGVLASNMCLSCHSGTIQADAYASSLHAASAQGPTCARCHNPNLANPSLVLPHPGYSITGTTANPGLFYSCVTCHYPGSTIVTAWPPAGLTFHNGYTGTNLCVNCHNQHSLALAINPTLLPAPHYNSISSGTYFYRNPSYSASYVTRRTQCSYCHGTPQRYQNNTTAAAAARADWSASGKGNVQSVVWMNSSSHNWHASGTANASAATSAATDCVRCHTSAGYVQYVTSTPKFSKIDPVGTNADKSSEPLTCNGCHNSDQGVDPFSVRSVGEVTAYYNYSVPNKKKVIVSSNSFHTSFFGGLPLDNRGSNTCIPCHTGRISGDTIKAAAAAGLDFTNANFMNSHYMSAAGSLYQSTGYTYYSSGSGMYDPVFGFPHPLVGIPEAIPDYVPAETGTSGPCIGCHMKIPNKHSFNPITKDANGKLKAVINPACLNTTCHFAFKDISVLQGIKDNFSAALKALRYTLQTKKSIFYDTTYPYFFKSAGPYTNANAFKAWTNSDTMGAAFNFNLFLRETGSYAHNSLYVKRLIYDSIDYIDDGNLGNHSVGATIDGLTDLTDSEKIAAKAYINPGSIGR